MPDADATSEATMILAPYPKPCLKTDETQLAVHRGSGPPLPKARQLEWMDLQTHPGLVKNWAMNFGRWLH